MSPQDTDHIITEAIQDHYKIHDSPYYLAELGKFFRANHIDIPTGVRFKDYLKSRFHDRFVVVQDTEDPARIAIAPLEKESTVLRQLSHQPSTVGDESGIDYARLPFALIAAFCKIPTPGTQVYFRLSKPFRYDTRPQPPAENYIEIEEQFRPPSLAGRSVHELSPHDKRTIYEHIEKWADNNSIDLRQFYYDLGPKLARPAEELTQTKGNALLRLIHAQDPEIRPQIRIPGDIASTLARLP